MEPFKNIFNKKSVKKLSLDIKKVYPLFNDKKFNQLSNKGLSELEMKDRIRHIASSLNETLPSNYSKTVKILVKSLCDESDHEDSEWEGQDVEGVNGFMTWPLLQFVETYGLDHFENSVNAMYEMTKRFSAEFAIRPYIQRYENKMFKIFNKWSKDKSRHVRRLCSEGTRPKLPWGMKVEAINKDIERNILLITKLKDDPEEYVRRSVANHLNDISKMDERRMLQICNDWNKNATDEGKWVIRHATRSLLKAGHPKALKLHGYNPSIKIKTGNLTLSKKKIKEGDRFSFDIKITNNSSKKEKLLIDYIIYYPKKNGKLSPKVFRLRDTYIAKGESLDILKEIHFKKVTTRKHYPGEHLLEIQVNGNKLTSKKFELK